MPWPTNCTVTCRCSSARSTVYQRRVLDKQGEWVRFHPRYAQVVAHFAGLLDEPRNIGSQRGEPSTIEVKVVSKVELSP